MTRSTTALALILGVSLLLPSMAEAARRRNHEQAGHQLFTSPQSNPLALSENGSRLYVANTTSNTVSVVSTSGHFVLLNIEVGIDPVSVAARPGANELWVSNHVSDTVSVIDLASGPTQHKIIATIQSLDANGVTAFDEPVGIAFTADGSKAYVALSSRNQVAVIDAASRAITGTIDVTAQEPRALAVRNGLLYVAAFESNNQTEASFCASLNGDGQVGSQCSLGLQQLVTFVTNPNIPGAVKNIVVDATLPDRDLFVYDTTTDTLVDDVSGIGTLLYGIAVDSSGRAYITQTDARNDVNGDHGLNLIDLDNRTFFNELATVACTGGGCSFSAGSDVVDLEPVTPTQATALATPYGIALSGDDDTLVLTAAASSRVFTMDTATLSIQDVLDLGAGADAGQQIPRGVALRSDGAGAAQTAYVLNTLENTVSVIDVSNPAAISETAQISVGSDPTPDAVRRGRIAFNNAFGSTTGTFSCASCHPDGNTDQLLWRIGGACSVAIGCDGDDEPRTTMPVRGLKNTLPLHWDGTLGDPFGGGNGKVGNGGVGGTDCSLGGLDGDHDCFVDLANESLGGVMCDPDPVANPSGCPLGGNELSGQEIDDMAFFLASVAYPPARSRRMNDTLSQVGEGVMVGAIEVDAHSGFIDFFTDQGGSSNPDTCADSDAGCHSLPLGTDTNSATLAGFDVPTMRGMTDRFVHFSLGPTAVNELLVLANAGVSLPGFTASPLEAPIRWNPAAGYREITTFGSAFLIFEGVYGPRPLDMFQMFEEASTGHSGATGRQVTLDDTTTTGGNLAGTEAILAALETADDRGLVNLRGVGTRNSGSGFAGLTLSYREATGTYKNDSGSIELTHAQLIADAQGGDLLMTFTGALRKNFGSMPQPLLAEVGTGDNGVTGDPPIPVIATGGAANPPPFNVTATDVRVDAALFLDGQPLTGTILCTPAPDPSFCVAGTIQVDLPSKPAAGLHLLQVQNNAGPLSNELPICVGNTGNCS